MDQQLFTAAEAAASINSGLGVSAFKRLADRHGIAYHKMGRERYYSAHQIAELIERTRRCPDLDEAQGSISGEDAGSSAGRRTDAHASAGQARRIAEKLKGPSKTSSPPAASAPRANVVRLRT